MTGCPFFQSSGNASLSQMFSYTSYSICAEVSRLAFKFSAVIPLGPGALLFFCFSTALLISSMAGFAVLTFKSKAGVSELSATSDGGRSQEADLEGHAEKYSAHLEIWSCCFVILLPGASLVPLDGDTVSLKAFLLCRRGPTSYAVVQQSTSILVQDCQQIFIYCTWYLCAFCSGLRCTGPVLVSWQPYFYCCWLVPYISSSVGTFVQF